MKVVIIFVLLFLPFEAFAGQIKIAGAMEEFSLREIIKDYKKMSRIKKKMEATRMDLRLLKSGSYDWFWRPKFLQKKIRGVEFEVGSYGDTPVIMMRF